MSTYSRPGVYIEEHLRPLSDVSTDPSESDAAFVGKTSAGGPVGPLLVTSWPQYQALYGQISYDTQDLSYAVWSFFQNGGRGAWIVRALASDATAAGLTLYDGTGTTTADEVLTVTAAAAGTWASDAASPSRVYVSTLISNTGADRFDLVVEVGSTGNLVAREQFVDLSTNPADPRYVVDIVNSPVVGSKYIDVLRSTNLTDNRAPGASTKVPLTGGADGVAAVDLVAATALLDTVDRNLVINVPGADATDISDIVSWAEAGGRHFIVADAPKPAGNDETPSASASALTTWVGTVPHSSQLAVYGPWYYSTDPGSRAGATRLTAPGGAVVAHYLRTDASRGVFKAPAGLATTITNAVQPFSNYTNSQLDDLANSGLNVLKIIPGSNVVIWGARTTALGTPDRYVPVRRLLIGLKSSLTDITRFAVFEPNDEDLRATIEDVVGQFLQAQFDLGAFKGSTPDDAFFVRCDETNNSPADQDAGVINIDVGVALQSPAEFIIIRLGQQEAGTVVTDSLEA
jgi:phage tail sheath protein FI